MAKVRWGVLGCANFARKRTIPALLETASAELIGVASRSAEKAERFRAEFDLPRAYASYEAMLDDAMIDAVYIPTPNGLHGTWMIEAAQRGKHALSEKPFTADAAEAERVAEVGARTGVRLMEGFMWRFHPQHLRARQAIDAGAIGAVRLVRAAFSFPLNRPGDVRLSAELAGGSVMDVGCYPISGVRYYFGDEPVRVYARGDFHPEYGVDMRMSGLFEFPGGRALVDSAFDLPFRIELEVVGESGTIRIPRAWLPDDEATLEIAGETERMPRANQYVEMFEHFSRCVTEGKPPRYGPADAVRQMRAIDAVYRSMRSGRPEAI